MGKTTPKRAANECQAGENEECQQDRCRTVVGSPGGDMMIKQGHAYIGGMNDLLFGDIGIQRA